MGIKQDLNFIRKEQKEIVTLMRVGAVLGWDQLVNLPKEGSQDRAEQIALIESKIHKKLVSKKLFTKIKKILKNKNLPSEEGLVLKKLYKNILKAKKLPEAFVTVLSKATSMSESAWQEAKEKNDFKIFQPHLEKIIKLKKIECKYLGFPGHPYNSLLDFFEEGMTVEKLKREFKILKLGLIEIINKIKKTEKYKKQQKKLTKKKFQTKYQMELIRDVVKRIGLSNTSTRLDFSVHPFTTQLGIKDVRITTAIRENPLFAFQAAMHEAGHGLYNLNLPENYSHTFLYDGASHGLHESQSRIWENNVGLSKPFWRFYFKEFKKKFNLKVSLNEWYEEINQLENTSIRLNSDEIQYCLHIIMRFELELELIEGKIQVKDLPKIWNKKIKEYFGIEVKNNSEGVLQDSHWSSGLLGYFPTYALGTIYASQLYDKIKEEIPTMEREIEKGNFTKMSKWLNEKIHNVGSTKPADKIIQNVCGEGLNVQFFLDYLNDKYSKIYKYKL